MIEPPPPPTHTHTHTHFLYAYMMSKAITCSRAFREQQNSWTLVLKILNSLEVEYHQATSKCHEKSHKIVSQTVLLAAQCTDPACSISLCQASCEPLRLIITHAVRRGVISTGHITLHGHTENNLQQKITICLSRSLNKRAS